MNVSSPLMPAPTLPPRVPPSPLPPDIRDVAGLVEWLRGRGGGHAEALQNLAIVRVAVNREYVGPEHPVREGDEVAIFPPVTGG